MNKNYFPIAVIAIVTNSCNLGCHYCYADQSAEKGIMDLKTLENMITKIALYNNGQSNTKFIWHGGEPLLAGLNFYQDAMTIQNKFPGCAFKNNIQTNGTLINQDLLDLFKVNNFYVGISLDGDAAAHNRNRPYKNGKNSFEDVFNNLLKVKENNIPTSIICVVNKTTEKHYIQILNFFKEHSINVKFNPQFPSGRASENPDLGLSSVEFGNLMITIFDKWFYDDTNPVIDIKPFSEIIGNLFEYKNNQHKRIIPFDCTFRNDCANSFLTVDPGGNVYTCGRFAGNPHFCMGNINSNSIEEMLKQKPVEIFQERSIRVHQDCADCSYLAICNSGCPEFAYAFTGDVLEKDGYCQGYKMLFSHIEKSIMNELWDGLANPQESQTDQPASQHVELLGRIINLRMIKNPHIRNIVQKRFNRNTNQYLQNQKRNLNNQDIALRS